MIEKGKRIRDDFDNWQCKMVGKTQQKHIQEEHMLSFKFLLNAPPTMSCKVHKKIMYIKHTNKQEAQ